MSKISQEVKDVATQLGRFFLQEKCGDYDAACNEITKLRINNLSLENGRLIIETSRPGLLIGRRGEQIGKIQEWMKMPIHIEETREHIIDYIYPYEPMELTYDEMYLEDWEKEQEEQELELASEKALEEQSGPDDGLDDFDTTDRDDFIGIMSPIRWYD